MPDCKSFLDRALELSLEAGRAILKIYHSDFDVVLKSDASPVTEADTQAEAIILKGLKVAFPDLPIVAEEEAAAGRVPDIKDEFVLVDPLDGTREFTSRNGAFTVNIALIQNGLPVAGVVHAPALERTFYGGRGVGAFEVRSGTSVALSARTANPDKLVAVASRSHLDDRTKGFLESLGTPERVSIGSSLKFCLIAAGEADIYPRFGRTMEWDTAAGHAVLAASGGFVTTDTGAPFLYGKRNQPHDVDFANGAFVARGKTAE